MFPHSTPSSLRCLVFVSILLSYSFAVADVILGRVVNVHDGDTITVLDDSKTQHKVRLAGIDAPELGQTFGQESRKYLATLVAGKLVTVEWHKRDKYGRIVGKVLQGSADAGLAQLQSGMAWHYKKYQMEQSAEDREAYAVREVVAISMRFGLWADDRAIPPWEWRQKWRAKAHETKDSAKDL